MSDSGGRTALVVVDMLNTYEHEDAERLVGSVRAALPQIRELVEDAREHDVETVYVNDNFGAWDSGRAELVERVLRGPYADLVEPIVPVR
ncbi:MAG TPA: isochorismatase family protein, partial [Solirubrobacteraceae bacterium]|nr:isochorismatase family protein [Solirubrobacteraceae bacterium]